MIINISEQAKKIAKQLTITGMLVSAVFYFLYQSRDQEKRITKLEAMVMDCYKERVNDMRQTNYMADLILKPQNK